MLNIFNESELNPTEWQAFEIENAAKIREKNALEQLTDYKLTMSFSQLHALLSE